jgi:DNA-directed RNA polymerase subunit RPC12/RpoP
MREVTPKELREYNEKSFKDTQKIFRRRLREIAAGGEKKARYNPANYCCGDRIADWLKSLGFTVKEINPIWSEITWPEEEEEDILERLRRECMPILNSSLPDAARRAIDGLKVKQDVRGTWKFEPFSYDYVCSECEKHAEYVSDYCPNCGKRMKVKKGDNKYV